MQETWGFGVLGFWGDFVHQAGSIILPTVHPRALAALGGGQAWSKNRGLPDPGGRSLAGDADGKSPTKQLFPCSDDLFRRPRLDRARRLDGDPLPRLGRSDCFIFRCRGGCSLVFWDQSHRLVHARCCRRFLKTIKIDQALTPETADALLAICLMSAMCDGEKSEVERSEIRRIAEEFGSGDPSALSRKKMVSGQGPV